MENKIKHLEFIQSVITRMAHNSFLIKGWVILGFGGVTTFANDENLQGYLFIVISMIFFFCWLDSYFLGLERKYRDLYNEVREKNEEDIDFNLSIGKLYFQDVLKVFNSITMLLFYGILFVLGIVFYFVIK